MRPQTPQTLSSNCSNISGRAKLRQRSLNKKQDHKRSRQLASKLIVSEITDLRIEQEDQIRELFVELDQYESGLFLDFVDCDIFIDF